MKLNNALFPSVCGGCFACLACLVFLVPSLVPVVNAFADGVSREARSDRERVVDCMRAMATVEWTPTEDIPYWDPDSFDGFKAGTKYEGIPYTQKNRETPLPRFLENLDGNARYTGPADYPGTDCSSSVSIAWRLVDPDIPCLSTYEMFPGMGNIVAVGGYDATSDNSTFQIVADNGADKIKECYAKMLPGDALLTRRGKSGHIRLVSAVDPEKQTVCFIDQSGTVINKPVGGKGTWHCDQEVSFDKLVKNGYIPIAHKKLVGQP